MGTREENMNRNEELFERLHKAVRDNKLNDIKDIRKSHPNDEPWNQIITDKDETVLHIAVANGREHIVKELVGYMSARSLEMKDSDGYTALTTAAVLGNWPMVNCMLDKNSDLISTRVTEGNNLPVVMAIDFGQIEMARRLYYHYRIPDKEWIPEYDDRNGATLLTCAIYAGTLDIALDLIKRSPRLALAIDNYEESPILALASMRQFFPSGNQLGFWKQPIYSRLSAPPTSDEACLKRVSNGEQCQSNQEYQSNILGLSAPPTNDEARLNISNVEQCLSNQEDQSNISGLSAPPTNDEAHLNISNGEQCLSNQEEQSNISGLSAPPTNDEARLNISNEEQCQSNQEDQSNISGLSAPPTNDEARLNVSNGEICQSNQEDQNNISGMDIPSATPTSDEALFNVSNGKQCQSNQENQNNISVPSATCCYLGSRVLDFLGITQLYGTKKIHVQSNELLSQMCHVISESNTKQLVDGLVCTAICRAAENGIVEFVYEMLNTNRTLILWAQDENGRNILMLGVLHRQEKIFSILYRLDGNMSRYLTCLADKYGNNMLHMAGMIEDSTRINQIPGAALQMQRELQWFKEVERIVRPKAKENKNKDGLTPQQLFTKNHADMKEKGEKWMKNTATSCTLVGILIVTIMFPAVFSFQGDNNQSMGLPKSLNNFLFNVFIISNALSLFSSSTSVLMFLGILTSRYSEEDFLEYLPRQMIIGLLTLFCSIATMMITFSSALLIILHERLRIAIPLICLASVPVSFFVWIQFPILKDMIISTYGPGIFNKKMKSTKLI
ncbi:hypothetical protein I3843_14G033500 [Carya illinoinensis]|uniref:PGG domain-containing protein n=1 Tax=Carya illinoinensis TaxID=32201 RepID=A0A922D9Z8_CARIL|nr:hypothetical protein I3842_14G034600 [Carya illinoinensis]KAG7946311.1 hypothetical protein I3843_14G033500 [Carya illinoinensis]